MRPQALEPPALHNPNFQQGSHVEVLVASRGGYETRLNVWFSLRRDCSLAHYLHVRVVFPPKHGTVAIRTGQFRPNYPKNTYRQDCNLQPHDGIAAFYRPVQGYIGPDELTLAIDAPDGKSWSTDFAIDVN